MGLEGTQEEEDAAKIIQNKFRDLKIRKKSKENLLAGKETIVVNVNGMEKGEEEACSIILAFLAFSHYRYITSERSLH